MLTLLTLVGMFGALSSSTPKISYTTKMDTWMVTSVVFVFATLLELVAVLVYKNIYCNNHNKNRNTSSASFSQAWEPNSTFSSQNKPVTNELTSEDIDKKLAFAEKCFVAIYFSFYIVFCLHYWLTILL